MFENFPKGGLGGPEWGLWKNFLIRAFHFMRRVRICSWSAFQNFSGVSLGGGPGTFSRSGPSLLCAGCVLERGLRLRFSQMGVWEGLGMALPNQGLHFYAQVAYLGGLALENFPKGGLGGPGMGGPGKISSSGPSIFCAGCVFAWGLHFRFFPG